MSRRGVRVQHGYVAIAYCDPNLSARVVPSPFRCGVWAVVKNGPPQCFPARWQVVHAPSGMAVRVDCGTKREAVRVCKRLGDACGMWAFDCGFGDAPEAPAKVVRLSGAKPIVRVP